MTTKTEYLRSVTTRLQLERAKLAKVRAYLRTTGIISETDQAHLDTLSRSIRMIQSDLSDLACASFHEWRSVKERLDRRLDTLSVPGAADEMRN